MSSFIASISAASRSALSRVFSVLLEPRLAIDPVFEPSDRFGEGVLVQAGSVIDTKCIIGNNVVFGFNVLAGHNSNISDHAFLAGGVILNGGVNIGFGSFLGMGSILYKDCGSWSKISPGTVCLKEIPDKKIVFGNPIKLFPNIQS